MTHTHGGTDAPECTTCTKKCPDCWGSGDEHYDGGFRTRSCRTCKGTGKVPINKDN